MKLRDFYIYSFAYIARSEAVRDVLLSSTTDNVLLWLIALALEYQWNDFLNFFFFIFTSFLWRMVFISITSVDHQ